MMTPYSALGAWQWLWFWIEQSDINVGLAKRKFLPTKVSAEFMRLRSSTAITSSCKQKDGTTEVQRF